MKIQYVIILLILTVLISGCVGGGDVFSFMGLDIGPKEAIYTASENLQVETEAVPDEIYGGEDTTIFFDIYNRGNTTVKDINLEMTDWGDFEPQGETRKHIDEMKEGDTETWKCKFNSKEVYNERTITLRYELSYNSNSTSMYDVAMMSEEEYTRLKRGGGLEGINLFYYKTKTPVEIDLSISREQPLFEGSEFYLYVQLNDVGKGVVDSIAPGNLVLYYPSDIIKFEGSNDFTGGNGKLVLSRPLKFTKKQTKKIACKFTVKDNINIRETGQFKAETNYIYTYHKTISVKVKPK